MSAAEGYRTMQVGHDRLQFARTFRPTWALVLGVLFLPVALLGLLFLLVKTTETCVVMVESDHRGTRVRLNGRLRDDVLGALRTALSGAAPAQSAGIGAPVATVAEARPGMVFAAAAPDVLITGAPSNIVAPSVGEASPPIPGAPPASVPAIQHTPLPSMAPPAPAAPPASMAPPAPAAPPAPVAPPIVLGPAPEPVIQLPPDPAPGPPTAAAAWDAPPPPDATPVTLPAPLPEPAPGPTAVEQMLCFDDGRRVTFGGFPIVLIGRDPTWSEGDESAGLITVDDPERSVSKTHLAIGTDATGFWVRDRNSTNGSTVIHADGREEPVPTDHWMELPSSSYVRFGARAVQVADMAMEAQR